MSRWTVFILVILNVTACASKAPGLTYYLLHSVQTEQVSQPDSGASVALRAIELPDYLNKSQLAYQTSGHTLHFAPAHLWAEAPETGIVKELYANLRSQGIRTVGPGDEAWTVELSIGDFIATWQSSVVLKGDYRITRPGHTPLTGSFDYRTRLQEDGYPHSVEKMRELLARLAGQLSNELTAMTSGATK